MISKAWAARLPGFAALHPLVPDELAQGTLQLLWELESALAEVGGIADAALPLRQWEPVAALSVLFFYLNRALQTSEVWYGYVAAGMAALIAGYEASDPWRGVTWSLMALGPFGFGWWRRLLDFRVQGYTLAAIGALARILSVHE